jgi:hypothetical protein
MNQENHMKQSSADTRSMTRQQLLERLQQMQRTGEDMSLPIVVRVDRHVSDNRKRNGHRLESMTALIQHAVSGSLGYSPECGEWTAAGKPAGGSLLFGELSATVGHDWRA